MKAGQVIEQDVPVQISLRIAKVDKATREVEGVCTQEVKDVHGEIVDHESMKAALLDWPGNIREMHQPIAVGKAVKVESDDTAKATILRARISKGAPDTWEKVLDGTLSMYSIGGTAKRVTSKAADGSVESRLFMSKLGEISLVDSGACPTAKFEIVKSVDGQAIECQPEEPVEAVATEKVAVVGTTPLSELFVKLSHLKGVEGTSPTLVAAMDSAIVKIEAARRNPETSVEKKAYPTPYNIEQTLGAIALLERILADEWWKVLDLANYDQESDLSTDRTQVQVLRNAISLVISYLLSEFEAQFADFDELTNNGVAADVMNMAIARRADLVEKAAFDLPMVFSKLDTMGQLWIAKAGARHSKADGQMVQAMHDTAVGLGAVDCSACAKAATEKLAAAPAAVVTEAPLDKAAAPAQSAPAAVVEAPAAAAPVQAPASAPETPVQNAAGVTAASVESLVASTVEKALQSQQATFEEARKADKAAAESTIADLQAQITKLSNEPMPGGPKARATGTEGTPVHKSIGNKEPSPLDGIDPAQAFSFAEQLMKDAKTQEERDRIVQNLLKFQYATGAGSSVVSQTVRRTE